MTKVFVYKLTTDNGGAPCVTSHLLTLAICKPSIRSAAKVDDWIFGFGDNKLRNRLIYIAKVTRRMIDGAYYHTKAFRSRADNIYRWLPKARLKPKRKPRYHGSRKDAVRDIGTHPEYRRANVLLSTHFRYFGDCDCKAKLPENVAEFIRLMGHGHRSGGTFLPLKPALRRFRVKVWKIYPRVKKLGAPLHPGSRSKCHRGSCREVKK